MNDKYLNKLKELLPQPIREFGGLVSLTFVVIFSFAILNAFFGQGDELVEKMKKEEVFKKLEKGKGCDCRFFQHLRCIEC